VSKYQGSQLNGIDHFRSIHSVIGALVLVSVRPRRFLADLNGPTVCGCVHVIRVLTRAPIRFCTQLCEVCLLSR
jgi:hypothetical protein